ncbi:cytochrome b/b6 domain-containing protein [Sphingomonas sp. GCM10030256]|uniref:cytochrome b/b6 domain-containing protein n=1 Tax=Sphingomonas sp. GCM10030256 TaxID=3273427 RepID=UPI00361D09D3
MKSIDPAERGETIQDAALAVPVWDLPIRMFHWSLVALIAFSWWSAENQRIEWHLWSGYAVLFALLFRIFWGFAGSSTARFSNFVTGPRGVVAYLHRARDWRRVGHTPLGALSVVALLTLLLAQVGFGLLLSDEDGLVSAPLNHLVGFETAELAHDVHQALFNGLLGFIILHVSVILFYHLLRNKPLTGAMINGSARHLPGAEPLVPASPKRLVACLVMAVLLTAWVIAGLPPIGT